MKTKEYKYLLHYHKHEDHVHFSLTSTKTSSCHNHEHDDNKVLHADNHTHSQEHDCHPCEDKQINGKIGKNDEGCPCCAEAIDLDEVTTALDQIISGNSNPHRDSTGGLADFSSPTNWGVVLGIAGPLALIGLTAAIRNIKGTIKNKKNINSVVKGLDEDIKRYKNQNLLNYSSDIAAVINRLEAFRNTLKYSEFDRKFNLVVPGIINGTASTVVLSSVAVSSPYALPIIALYAGCQTLRNGYDLWRIWNKILPENIREEIQLNIKVGIRKINQITTSRRKFYAANTLGFATFTIGALITTLSVLSVAGAPGIILGIPLLAAGTISTGITNNIWTNRFKPRNGDLSIEREKLDTDSIAKAIGEKREIKRILKNYRDKHLPERKLKRFSSSLLSSLPFCKKIGARLNHEANQSRIYESSGDDKSVLDLLERIVNAKIILSKQEQNQNFDSFLERNANFLEISAQEKNQLSLENFDYNSQICEQILKVCKELELDTILLERFIKNAIIKSSKEHDKSIENEEEYCAKLKESGLFKIENKEIHFLVDELEKKAELKEIFISSLKECLLFDCVDKLKYEQYGLNDFYWSLSKQNKKHSHENHSHENHSHENHSHENHSHENHSHENHSHENHSHENHSHEKHSHEKHSHENHSHENHSPKQPNNKTCSQRQSKTLYSFNHNNKILLGEFKLFAEEKISATNRSNQIAKQNNIIDNILLENQQFILKSETKNIEQNKTVFVYLDPNYQDPKHPEYEQKQITYIRNDFTGIIDVIYGEKANALLIERPKEDKNGLITTINNNILEYYGDKNNTSFQLLNKETFKNKEWVNSELKEVRYRSTSNISTERCCF